MYNKQNKRKFVPGEWKRQERVMRKSSNVSLTIDAMTSLVGSFMSMMFAQQKNWSFQHQQIQSTWHHSNCDLACNAGGRFLWECTGTSESICRIAYEMISRRFQQGSQESEWHETLSGLGNHAKRSVQDLHVLPKNYSIDVIQRLHGWSMDKR